MKYIISIIEIMYYICSIIMKLITELMKAKTETAEPTTFKEYFISLNVKEKNALRDSFTPAFVAYTTFYSKLRDNSWSELELQKLEELTGKTFERK